MACSLVEPTTPWRVAPVCVTSETGPEKPVAQAASPETITPSAATSKAFLIGHPFQPSPVPYVMRGLHPQVEGVKPSQGSPTGMLAGEDRRVGRREKKGDDIDDDTSASMHYI